MATRLLLVLEDQLDRESILLADADPDTDIVLMAELPETFRAQPFHKIRLALILSAMRHFREDLEARGLRVDYQPLTSTDAPTALGPWLQAKIDAHAADEVHVVLPGDLRQLHTIEAACEEAEVPLTLHDDAHFLSTPAYFDAWADGRKRLTLEYFYREMRRDHDVLIEGKRDPVGGEWNFDGDNRESFSSDGPGLLPEPPTFASDAITDDVCALVDETFADHPGTLDGFNLPVTPAQAEDALEDFITNRLPTFGTYQDAMWTNEPFLYHSRLSTALNLRLLHPRQAIDAAEEAYHAGDAPINAVEGFIRQILGWREFIRGVYYHAGEGYDERNALEATESLPEFYWSGETHMTCVQQTVDQLKETAYAHHIQRLMVTGLFSLLYGADPQEFDAWHLSMYADAWPWVSAPNTIGMSQYADGGLVATKPYTASGKYINRMSNYCSHCRYDPGVSAGEDACPFTTLYWDFLQRHEDTLSGNRRMNFQLANVRRKSDDQLEAIQERAAEVRAKAADGSL
jgi:deoxyribodipyrimidine photolyase-related protein